MQNLKKRFKCVRVMLICPPNHVIDLSAWVWHTLFIWTIFDILLLCLLSLFQLSVNNDKLYIFFSSIQKRTCASHWLLNQRMRKSHRSFHGRSSNVRRTYLLFLLPLMKSLKSTPSCVLNYQKYRYSHLLVLSFRECQDNTFFGAAG